MVIFLGQWDGNVFFRKKYWYQWFFGGFATPSPMVNHHYHLMFFSPLTIAFNGFSYKPLKKLKYTYKPNGFEVTQPSPLNDFQPPNYCFQWCFDGFQI